MKRSFGGGGGGRGGGGARVPIPTKVQVPAKGPLPIRTNRDSTPARKLTAVGTVGEKGQLFTVYERNWHCLSCNHENYPVRIRCVRCKKKKPEGIGHDYVQDAALLALKAGETISWHEAVDPVTNQIYYYNKDSGVTQWERPVEMGEAPTATGWFGRGQAGSNAAQKYSEKNMQYISKPAKKQKDYIDPKKYHAEGANEYNIWYDKYVGDMKDNSSLREPAEDRCVVERDAGYTKADTGGINRKEKRHFCLHFARGMCAKAEACTYYHRIPLPVDDANCDEMVDCFGRQRHATHRDNMNGVGSFMNPSRTLFVGSLSRSKYATPKALEDAMWKHFSEWGEVEHISVIHRLSIAFPRYRLRTSAEFAKEAMQCQPLDHREVLSIRWAKDDPNPVAQDSICRADKDALAALLHARGISTVGMGFEYPIDYVVPDAKRSRGNGDGVGVDEGSGDYGVGGGHGDGSYPNTDIQYNAQYTDGQYYQPGYVSNSLLSVNEDSTGSAGGVGVVGIATVSGDNSSSESVSIPDNVTALYTQHNSQTSDTTYFPWISTSAHLYDSSIPVSDPRSITASDPSSISSSVAHECLSDTANEKKRLLESLGLGALLGDDSAGEEGEGGGEEAGGAVTISAMGVTIKEDEGAKCKDTLPNEHSQVEEEEEKEEKDEADEEEQDGQGGWTAHIDPDTGATYYYNISTGESSWGLEHS